MFYNEKRLEYIKKNCVSPDWLSATESQILPQLKSKFKSIEESNKVLIINFTKINLNYCKIDGQKIFIALAKNEEERERINNIWNAKDCKELFDYIVTEKEFECLINDMKFDKIIMNPPYSKNLHLKIIEKAIDHLTNDGECVNLSPIVLPVSIRNNWSELAVKKLKAQKCYKHMTSLERINGNGFNKMFKAGAQNAIGITTYKKSEMHDINPLQYAETNGLPSYLIKKIMAKCLECSLKVNPGEGRYVLPMSEIHGNIGAKDFLNIMAMTYEKQLKSKGCVNIQFKSENDRHEFYDFWMSPLGKMITSLWKVDTHVMINFIPYFWCKDIQDFYKFFNITEDEQKIIEETIEKYK